MPHVLVIIVRKGIATSSYVTECHDVFCKLLTMLHWL